MRLGNACFKLQLRGEKKFDFDLGGGGEAVRVKRVKVKFMMMMMMDLNTRVTEQLWYVEDLSS